MGTKSTEVGAGTGACGLLAALLGARRVVLSDFQATLLRGLAASAERVPGVSGCAASISSCGCAKTSYSHMSNSFTGTSCSAF